MRRENKAIFGITVSWEYILFSVKGRLQRLFFQKQAKKKGCQRYNIRTASILVENQK